MTRTFAELSARLPQAMAADAARLARRLDRARVRRAAPAEWARLAQDVERAVARRAARLTTRPPIAYAGELPVSAQAGVIEAAIRNHQVVIVCGETGSGKTTQLPKICIAAGRGERGLIGHTQPRRIAARAVATRIAQEMGEAIGHSVGYKVRFTDQTRPDAWIKLMTDGILLAETQGDGDLDAYDTIIVDEAHERSLNIDFLLGYLKQLLARRPDLKVVITSATLDAERFARHFGTAERPAPVLEVSGRVYPVEVRYRPLCSGTPTDSGAPEEADDEEELEEAIVAAAEELWRGGPGDILVFLPGEREIRETAELARRSLARRPYAQQLEILPLFARLSVPEQQRVFAPGNGRRMVLATNVAETSLTVPGIRYVIDAGLARVKRYSVRNKTTLLQIEKIAQSAANQRAGRCGRVQDGICVRLYAEDDFTKRPLFTEPEILRSSLAAVILRMTSLRLGEVASFPFLEAPPPRAIADGYALLQELSAVDDARALTPLGAELARLPLDPRIGRIVLAARDSGCLPEALIIASALAVPDPRERPFERAKAADQAHLRFRDDRSDFLSLVALWEFFADLQRQGLSHRRVVDACRAQFVSFLRLSEWRDVHRQLVATLDDAGWTWKPALPKAFDPPQYAVLHKAILAGLLGNVGVWADADDHYLGARGLKFHLHPSSGLARKGGKWVLAAELTETSRLYARNAARIEPEWIEEVAGDRVNREYFEPHWEERRGEVVASERVQLHGLTLVARRPVSFGAIDPELAREVFIREALVPGALRTRGAFLARNRRLVAEIGELEHKARRQDVLVDDETIAAFYDERVPAGVLSLATFEQWREDAERGDPQLLAMSRDDLMRHAAAAVTVDLYPETLSLAGTTLPVKYRFSPGHPLDGLTLTVPLALLNQVSAAALSWLVPGMERELITHYLKSLPKAWRNRVVPVPDFVSAFIDAAPDRGTSVADALRAHVAVRTADMPPADLFDGIELPAHLRVHVVVVDASGQELASGRALAVLREQLGQAAQLSFAGADPAFERTGIVRWDFGDLPEQLHIDRGGRRLTGYPALVDATDSVSLVLLDTAAAAADATRGGVLRLMRREMRDAIARFEKGGSGFAAAALQLKTTIGTETLLADVLAAALDRALLADDPLPRTAQGFGDAVKRARTRLPAVIEGAFRVLQAIAVEVQAVNQRLLGLPKSHARIGAEVRAQRDALVYPGFFMATPWAQLHHLPRYLRGLDRRLAKYAERPDRDARHADEVGRLWQQYAERAELTRRSGRADSALDDYRWLLEELRISLFAQELKTPFPVSFKRLSRAWADLPR